MNPYYRLLIVIAGCAGTFASQAQDTLYSNRVWRKTRVDSASYYRIKSKVAEGWKSTVYYMNGKVEMTGLYSDDSLHHMNGEFVWYDSTGNGFHHCNYVNNKKEGAESYYFKNGKLEASGQNKNDKPDGEWTGNYPSGKLSGKATYRNGEQVKGTFFNEDGSARPEVTVFMREADFPGGPNGWLRYLNRNFKYPKAAIKAETEGMVVVGFVVSPEGQVSNLRIEQSVSPELDAEALRVVAKSRDWLPSILGGRNIEGYKRQPIVFRLK